MPSSQAAGGGHRANVSGRPEAGAISSLTLPLDCELLKDLTVTSQGKFVMLLNIADPLTPGGSMEGRKDATRKRKNERKIPRARQKWYFSKCCFYNVLKIKNKTEPASCLSRETLCV